MTILKEFLPENLPGVELDPLVRSASNYILLPWYNRELFSC